MSQLPSIPHPPTLTTLPLDVALLIFKKAIAVDADSIRTLPRVCKDFYGTFKVFERSLLTDALWRAARGSERVFGAALELAKREEEREGGLKAEVGEKGAESGGEGGMLGKDPVPAETGSEEVENSEDKQNTAERIYSEDWKISATESTVPMVSTNHQIDSPTVPQLRRALANHRLLLRLSVFFNAFYFERCRCMRESPRTDCRPILVQWRIRESRSWSEQNDHSPTLDYILPVYDYALHGTMYPFAMESCRSCGRRSRYDWDLGAYYEEAMHPLYMPWGQSRNSICSLCCFHDCTLYCTLVLSDNFYKYGSEGRRAPEFSGLLYRRRDLRNKDEGWFASHPYDLRYTPLESRASLASTHLTYHTYVWAYERFPDTQHLNMNSNPDVPSNMTTPVGYWLSTRVVQGIIGWRTFIDLMGLPAKKTPRDVESEGIWLGRYLPRFSWESDFADNRKTIHLWISQGKLSRYGNPIKLREVMKMCHPSWEEFPDAEDCMCTFGCGFPFVRGWKPEGMSKS